MRDNIFKNDQKLFENLKNYENSPFEEKFRINEKIRFLKQERNRILEARKNKGKDKGKDKDKDKDKESVEKKDDSDNPIFKFMNKNLKPMIIIIIIKSIITILYYHQMLSFPICL